MSFLRTFLLLSTVIPLAACGADDIASPGEDTVVLPPSTPTPTPGTPTPTPGTPAAACPAGTLETSETLANRRVCRLPNRIENALIIQNLPGVIYSISGRTDVGFDVGGSGNAAGGASASLTLEPGTIVFGSSGADFLVVNRGSQLFAEGAATNPIIFTSRQNVEGTATDTSSNQWGGILLLGRAPISNCNAAGVVGGSVDCQQLAEGPGADAFYGGATANDSSGTLRYVQIRYTGFSVVPNNELQGLTTAGVGSGTTIQFVQIHNSGDDGIEIFGGRHNLKRAVITGADDDTLDTDFGYKGFIQFVIGIQRPQGGTATGDTMIEADSNSPGGDFDFTPRQNTQLANFTFVQSRPGRQAILLRGGTDYSLFNGIVQGPTNCLDVDQLETVQDAGPDEAGKPVIRSVVFSCPTFADPDGDDFEAQALGRPGNDNNNTAFTTSLTSVFVNGPNETAVPAVTNLSTVNAFFENVTYIGAVRDNNDIWYRGWTCDSSYANFGSGRLCTAL